MAATAKRTLSVDTAAGKDQAVETFTGVEGLSQLFSYEVELLATSPLDFAAVLGKPATIRVSAGAEIALGGIVAAITEGTLSGKTRRYRLEVAPEAWLLTRGAQSRMFQNLSVPDILKKVFEGVATSFTLQGTYAPRATCVQYRESDFAFASRLMEEEGIFYFFEQPSGKMIIANALTALPDLPGSPLRLDEAAGVFAWETRQEIRARKVTLRDHSFELPNDNLEASKPIAASVAAGAVTHSLQAGPERELYDFPGGYAQRFDSVGPGGADQAAQLQKLFTENKRVAAVRIEEEAAQAIAVAAQARCVNLISGRKFTLQGDDRAAGAYVLTRVEHSVSVKDGRAVVDSRIECLPAAVPPRPRRRTPRPIAALQSAVVTGPAGEELFVDKYGRIKVQFGWDRQGTRNAESSGWIRVGQIAASKLGGAMFVPRIGDEVLVDFIDGDPDKPVVVGSVYNAENMPPLQLPANKTASYVIGAGELTLRGGGAQVKAGAGGIALQGKTFGVRADEAQGEIRLNVGAAQLVLSNDGSALIGGRIVDVLTTNDPGALVNVLSNGKGMVIKTDGSVQVAGKSVEVVSAEPSSIALIAGAALVTLQKDGIAISGNGVNLKSGGGAIELATGDARVRLSKDGGVLLSGKDVDVHSEEA